MGEGAQRPRSGRFRDFRAALRLQIEHVEFLGDVWIATDQLAGKRELVDRLVAEDHDTEALARLVPDPRARLVELRERAAQLVDRRLRVEEAPDQDADDQNGPRGT
jgi:uncharacterized protein YhaN